MCIERAALLLGRFLGKLLLGENDDVPELRAENQGFGGLLSLEDDLHSEGDLPALLADYDCNGDLRF